MSSTGSSSTLLLGTRKGLLTFRARGSGGSDRWELDTVAFSGQPVSFAFRDARTGATWAAIDHGHWGQKLHRSTDGVTWDAIPVPAYPEGAEAKPGVPAKLEYIWCLAAGSARSPGRIYAGTNPGGLFVTDDPSGGFTLVESLWNHPSRPDNWFGGGRDTPGIHSIWEDPRDPKRVLVAVSCAGIFETLDGGATWAPRNKGLRATFLPDPNVEVGHDPHLLAVCAGSPDVMWQQNHCGIWRSTDGAASWTEVGQKGGPAHFGFPIVAHDTDPEVAWVVPAESDERRIAVGGALLVCRTTDGGKSWEPLRRGLPQTAAFDVVYRHAFDRSGATLAFGSTTGNVYLSEDDGEAWTPLGHHLPPVYSARFA
ncbi:MAG: glycosyl hydrolase [Pseudomonadota bacterium]|nr:glycosyl hydrolase [Pseudomonadota bacterium]